MLNSAAGPQPRLLAEGGDPNPARRAVEAPAGPQPRLLAEGGDPNPARRREVKGIAVLASGSGTILEAMLEEELPVSVVVVDRSCRAMEVATSAGIPALLVERQSFGAAFDRLGFTHAVLDALAPYQPELVAMAGFGTVLEKPLFDAYPERVLNTHPALLPAFPGWHAVEDALAAGVKVTGCTVHVATIEVDAGPILAQEAVPVREGDTVASLHERIKDVERRLYPETIRKLIGS